MSGFKIQCPSCRTIYTLPNAWKESFANRLVTCVACKRPWVTFPEIGPLKAEPTPLQFDLTAYRVERIDVTGGSGSPDSTAPPPATATQTTQQVTIPPPIPPPATAQPPRAPVRPTQPMPAPARPSGPPPSPAEDDPLDGTVLDVMAGGAARFTRLNPLEGLEVGLVFLEGQYKGKGYRIKKTPTVIGRTNGDVIIPDGRVSRKHAELEVLGPGQYSLKDLASTNGTQVNDRRISTTRLENGDVVSFGGTKLKFVARPIRRRPDIVSDSE